MPSTVVLLDDVSEQTARDSISCHFGSDLRLLMEQRTDSLIKGNTSIPIAFVSNQLTASIGAKSTIIRLSKDTLNKIFNKHQHVITNGILCHEKVQYLIDNGLVIKEGRNNYTLVILFIGSLRDNNGITKLYKLAIKVTKNRDEIYLTTLHPIQSQLKQNIVDNGILIRQQSQAQSYYFILLLMVLISIGICYLRV